MKTSRRKFIKQSALLALIAAGMEPFSLVNMGCAQTLDGKASADKVLKPTWRSIYPSDVASINQVPYISTYYIEPKVKIGEKPEINYYVTDYDQIEYMYDDYSAVFTIDYWVNGVKSTIKDVKAGDHSITLDALPKGKVLFALQATDSKGRKSHRFFHEFLIVDPADEVIPESKVLNPDLKKFNIHNDDTHPVETTKGLTEMLQWAHDNGYRKVLLPQGRYRLDENKAVQMATNLTLDMNGSTFKLNPSEVTDLIMLEMHNCFDSHIVNGTFEGDLKERTEQKLKMSEHVRGPHFSDGSEYCSYQNITIQSMTGYGTVTKFHSGGPKGARNKVNTGKAGKFTFSDVDSKGELVTSSDRMTTKKPVDISVYKESHGFLQMGMFLGYQGNPTGSWVYQAHFYDANNKYLETIGGYMYRRLCLPDKAKYVRFTVVPRPERIKKIQRLFLFDFRAPYNCAFVNVHHEDVRCVGMVPSGFANLLVEKCTFENCGWAGARCAFDCEDGWDLAQDLTFRNNVFGENPYNEFVCPAGHNVVAEDNVMGVGMRNRYYVLRNNKLKSASFQFGTRRRTGAPRVQGNTIAGSTRLSTKGTITEPFRPYCIRDNECQGDVGSFVKRGTGGASVAYFYKCKIQGEKVDAIGRRFGDKSMTKFVQCQFKDVDNTERGYAFEIYESTIDNCQLKTTSDGGDITVIDSKITKSQIQPHAESVVLLQGNTMQNSSGSGDGEDHEWILRDNKIETSLGHLIAIEKYYKQVVLDNNVVTSTNPNFSAILLNGAIRSSETTVAVAKSTFKGKGGFVLNMTKVPAGKKTLTAYLYENKYNGIEEISKNALDSANVKIIRTEPVAA